MNKFLVIIPLLGLSIISAKAQYCSITSATAYSPEMPGITNFTLNTIDRSSASLECAGANCNSYVSTNESTNLERGKTYSISITHTRDAISFPSVPNNLRIWIDYNNNGTWDDAGETVVSLNNEAVGVTTSSFTVPMNASLGNTGMRITAKMSESGGHTLPSSCDVPPDPLGYHGEIEDYDVNITLPTGLIENSKKNEISIYPNPANDLLNVHHTFQISIPYQIIDIYGRQMRVGQLDNTTNVIDVSELSSGQYLLIIQNESGMMNNIFHISR